MFTHERSPGATWAFRSLIVFFLACFGIDFGHQAKAQLDQQFQNNQRTKAKEIKASEEGKKIICANAQFQDEERSYVVKLFLVADGGHIWSAYDNVSVLCSPFCPPSKVITNPEYMGQLNRQRTGSDGRQELWKVEGNELVFYNGGFTNVYRSVYKARTFRNGIVGRDYARDCDRL